MRQGGDLLGDLGRTVEWDNWINQRDHQVRFSPSYSEPDFIFSTNGRRGQTIIAMTQVCTVAYTVTTTNGQELLALTLRKRTGT